MAEIMGSWWWPVAPENAGATHFWPVGLPSALCGLTAEPQMAYQGAPGAAPTSNDCPACRTALDRLKEES